MAEFSAALVFFIVGIGVPLLDLSVMPIRWVLWQQALNADVHKLAQSESFSNAVSALNFDSSLATRSIGVSGVKEQSSKCTLVITMLNPPGESFIAEEPKSIQAEWLPGGKRSPCSYELEISSLIQISPLILVSGSKISIPGLTSPLLCRTIARAHWENYGRDPLTKQFFMNE